MKKLLFILPLLLSLAAVAYVVPSRSAAFRTAAAGGCSLSQTTNAWSHYLDGYVSGYDSNGVSTVTEVGTTANITEGADSSALTTYKPAGACDTALKVIVPNDGTETYTRFDIGTIDMTSYAVTVTLDLYIEDPTSGIIEVWGYNDTSSPSTGQGLYISTSGAQMRLYARGQINSATINVSEDQWYTVRISFDTAEGDTGSTLDVWSNGTLIGSETFKRATDDSFSYFFIGGAAGVDGNEGCTLWFDNCAVKAQ